MEFTTLEKDMIYPIIMIYFTGKLNEVFPIVINVSNQVRSAVIMFP